MRRMLVRCGAVFLGVCFALFALGLAAGVAFAEDKTVELKLSHFVPPQHAFHKWVTAWAENLEKESNQPGLRLQNSKLLKAELNGEFMARTGSMVAYQGQVQFEAL